MEIREESINVFDLQSNQLLWIYDEQQDEIQHNQILNLSDEGDRWEGDVFHDSPYGWGLLYDSNNNKAYEGFRLGNVNAGYGRSYYSEIGKKEYEGQICNGKRWGRGTQYDRNEHEVFDGEWINDACLQSSVVFSNATQILHNHIEELTFSENCCNEVHLNAVAFDCFALLRTITIHSNSFKHPKQVKFQHMHCLESITVERNCFKETEKGFDKLDRTFICSDNPRLKSIHIDCMSFPEFRECIIHSRFTSTPSEVDLPSLEELQFGQEDKHSLCFYWSDCVLQDLPSLRSISLGPYCFYSSRHTVFESDSSPSLSSSDLPLLTSIQLGRFALLGDNHPSCDLTLRSRVVLSISGRSPLSAVLCCRRCQLLLSSNGHCREYTQSGDCELAGSIHVCDKAPVQELLSVLGSA